MNARYVKICGLQTAETVIATVAAGADALGFVFAPGSPRTVAAETVANLTALVPSGIETVGVFRNQPIADVLAIAAAAKVSTVQLHGDESLTEMQQLKDAGFQTLRAFSIDAYAALSTAEREKWDQERLLLDAVEPGAGVTFDASTLTGGWPSGFWLLAGGLNSENVAELMTELHPHGVDVSSGVESTRGVKDITLIQDFIRAARG